MNFSDPLFWLLSKVQQNKWCEQQIIVMQIPFGIHSFPPLVVHVQKFFDCSSPDVRTFIKRLSVSIRFLSTCVQTLVRSQNVVLHQNLVRSSSEFPAFMISLSCVHVQNVNIFRCLQIMCLWTQGDPLCSTFALNRFG